ncbi:MAG: hypothetical protein JSW45_03210 [Thiotrichales bacterium]|nr:MAG: hypothetical protein JSW45_03210 [Thiotrichales bacterium]
MEDSGDIPSSATQCYSQRLLNPFRGAVNVIRYKSAEAVTSDGIHWDIYVSNDALLEGLDKNRSIQISDIRYGRWSERDGLTRGPVYPSDEFYALEAMAAVVYQHLLKVYDQVPFPFRDRIELWLLDRESRPLALLNAVVDQRDIEDYQLLDWRAGQLCRETFDSAFRRNTDNDAHSGAADQLIEYINSCAGTPPAAQWFERNEDGSAIALHGHNIDDGLIGRSMVAEDFAEYFLSVRTDNEQVAGLVRDFIEWQAPWLLLLDSLGYKQRQGLEQCARKQALITDQQYLLYPEIIDDSFIRAARVEAKLRKAQMQKLDQDEVMSTFYIELHPSPTE